MGISVSLSEDGTVLAIGARNGDYTGRDNGRVQVYELIDSPPRWSPKGQRIFGDAANDHLGAAVSLSADGNVLAVSAASGFVRIFRFNRELGWVQVGHDIVGDLPGSGFGGSLELSSNGTVVVVGAHYASNQTGIVSVFKQEEEAWVPLGANLTGNAEGAQFGLAVALSDTNDILAVGAPGTSYVQTFQFDGQLWQEFGELIDGQEAGEQFGRSVALSANGFTLAVGAINSDGFSGPNFFSGEVRAFRYVDPGIWRPLGQGITGRGRWDYFGSSVSLSGDGKTLAVGATQQFAPGQPAGFARCFFLSDEFVWEPLGNELNGAFTNDDFGYSIALSRDGLVLAIGAPQFLTQNDDVPTNNTGYAKVYLASM